MATWKTVVSFVVFVSASSAHAQFGLFGASGCGMIPPSVQTALKQARQYYGTNQAVIEHSGYCGSTGRPGKKIVINDYTSTPSRMYVFDSQDEERGCLMSALVDFGAGRGVGRGSSSQAVPGCGPESHLTPPGFHITAEGRGGEKYPYPEGMAMVSCEGQGSIARGVKVHKQAGVGGPTTWGCSTLDDANYQKFLQEVRGCSLIYNYFGDRAASAEACKPTSPDGSGSCSPEEGFTGRRGATGYQGTGGGRSNSQGGMGN